MVAVRRCLAGISYTRLMRVEKEYSISSTEVVPDKEGEEGVGMTLYLRKKE